MTANEGCRRLTERVWQPEHSVTGEEERALSGSVPIDRARDIIVALTHPTIRLRLRVRLHIRRVPPGPTRTLARAPARLERRVRVPAQALEAERVRGLLALAAVRVRLERAADGCAALRVGVAPHREAHAVVRDVAAPGGLGVLGRGGGGPRVADDGGRPQECGGGARVGEGVFCVRIREGGGGVAVVCVGRGEERGAEEVARGRWRKRCRGCREAEGEGVDRRGRLQRRRDSYSCGGSMVM